LLHLAPHLVRLDRIEAGPTDPVAELLPSLRDTGVRALSPNGVLGDPWGATANEGKTNFDALVGKVSLACVRLVGGAL
jgi:creatinine amidohydrolase/Fe(II)-dependent formamide hydrolase-like protein